ncbi:hypothetical protein, partial [Clavibacter michiganensis]|uniref:hypothetical protein n=1 Tax=Clavibacter michiganensis TaxID=28447 RepID=UPI00292F0582
MHDDYLGAVFIASGVSHLLIWRPHPGKHVECPSCTSYLLAAASYVLPRASVFTDITRPARILRVSVLTTAR